MTRCKLAGWVMAMGLLTAPHAQSGGSATLDAVKARGLLICGVSTGVMGFSLADSKGVVQGLDADGCRAVAAVALAPASW